MYHLKDGLEKVFVKEELMLIPEDTELLLDYVQNCENVPASKNEFPNTRTLRAEHGSVWVNPKVATSANECNLPHWDSRADNHKIGESENARQPG